MSKLCFTSPLRAGRTSIQMILLIKRFIYNVQPFLINYDTLRNCLLYVQLKIIVHNTNSV